MYYVSLLLSQIGVEGWIAILGTVFAALGAAGAALLAWYLKLVKLRSQLQNKTEEMSSKSRSKAKAEARSEMEGVIDYYKNECKEKDKRNDQLEDQIQKFQIIISNLRQQSDFNALRAERCRERMVLAKLGSKYFYVIATTNGKMLYVGTDVTKFIGYMPDELEGKHVAILTPQRYRRPLITALKQFIQTNDSGEVELHAIRRVDSFILSRDNKEIPAIIAATCRRFDNLGFVLIAKIFPFNKDDTNGLDISDDPGHTDEGPMKALEVLPEDKTPPPT